MKPTIFFVFLNDRNRYRILIENLSERLLNCEIITISNGSFREYKSKLKQLNPSLILFFSHERKFVKYTQQRQIRSLLIPLSFLLFNRSLKTNGSSIGYEKLDSNAFLGSPIIESISDYKFTNFDGGKEFSIAVVGITKDSISLIRSLALRNKSYSFLISKCGYDFGNYQSENVIFSEENRFDLLKNCNMALTFSEETSLEACLLNCPQVHIEKQSVLRFFKDKFNKKPNKLLINQISRIEMVRSFVGMKIDSDSLTGEIKKILDDPQYCAEILAGYQIVKEKIANKKPSREIARIINETLESGGS